MTGRVRYAIGIVPAGVVLAALLYLPTDRWASFLIEWIRGAGALGLGVYGLVYVGATLLLLPGWILSAGAGFVYGPLWGTFLVSPVSVLAATLAFIVGRSTARSWVSRRVEQYPAFAPIDQAIAENGFKIVFLLRLSPLIPFNVLNYALGLTRVRARDYVVASLLGMLPGTFLYVYLGSLVTSATELAGGRRPAAGVWGQILYWGGLIATLFVTVLITRIAKKVLDQTLAGPMAAGRTPPASA